MRYPFLLALLIAAPAYAEVPRVVVSIKPLHSLVSAVMEGSGAEPLLLVDGVANPHNFQLKPSQVKAIHKADVVFYIGDGLEAFLAKALEAAPNVRRMEMEKQPGMVLHPARGWQEHDHVHGAQDLHLWLDPANARRIVAIAAAVLSEADPAQKKLYDANAARTLGRIDALDGALKARMKKLQGKPFIVFHDAYQYFEKAYGLSSVGAIVLHPELPLGAQHIHAIRAQIAQLGEVCVFREPQFSVAVVESLTRGTQARSGALDPEGAQLANGPGLYFELMEQIARGLEDCLKG